MLTSSVKKRLEVPGEIGQWVEIRKLGWRKLQEAAEAASRLSYEHVRVLGKDGIEAVRAVTADQIKAFKANPASQYDPGTLLRAAVIAWSYSDKPTPAEIDDLEETTQEWLLEEIVALAKPPRDEAIVKNDSSASAST